MFSGESRPRATVEKRVAMSQEPLLLRCDAIVTSLGSGLSVRVARGENGQGGESQGADSVRVSPGVTYRCGTFQRRRYRARGLFARGYVRGSAAGYLEQECVLVDLTVRFSQDSRVSQADHQVPSPPPCSPAYHLGTRLADGNRVLR